jgi:hypothetical protein
MWSLRSGQFADGNYTARLSSAPISNSAHDRLDGDGDGLPGGIFVTTFFSLKGDANHDRSVDFNDLAVLAQHYNSGSSELRWADGDFTGDGIVDFLDLAFLAQNYNTSLPGAAAAPAPTAVTPPVAASAVTASTPKRSPVTKQPPPPHKPTKPELPCRKPRR